jgi:hypothetical protein
MTDIYIYNEWTDTTYIYNKWTDTTYIYNKRTNTTYVYNGWMDTTYIYVINNPFDFKSIRGQLRSKFRKQNTVHDNFEDVQLKRTPIFFFF